MINTFVLLFHFSVLLTFCVYVYHLMSCSPGPDFGSPPSFSRRNLASILHESGKICSLIDEVNVLNRYSDASCNSIAVFSDNDALSRSMKEVCTMVFQSQHCLRKVVQVFMSC
jgi:hypothetical protein